MKALLAAVAISAAVVPMAIAQGRLADEPIRGSGSVGFSNKPLPLRLEGTSPTIGHFTALGEIRVAATKGGWLGSGAVVFKNEQGGRLVGLVAWTTDARGNGEMKFDWKDSVKFSDGTVATSTGVFAKTRPAKGRGKTTGLGLVTISIIAILIG